MNETITCAYGGNFDMPTMGHYHIIEKASLMFDCVYVVLARSANKSQTMFTEKERLAMLNDMAKLIDPSGEKVKIVILPSNTYLANYVSQLGAKFLIRGIRDQIDFGYEQTIYRTNRRIQPKVETIYLMPDDAYNIISSSWVKGLIGYNGWANVIKNSVTPFVLKELKKHYLKNQFLNFANNTTFKHILRNNIEVIWEEIVAGYESKEYHGFDHLISMFDSLNAYVEKPDPCMIYAIWMHDIDPSEDKSVEIACSHIRMVSRSLNDEDVSDKITRLIKATKHTTCEYSKEDEQIIATLDLLVLASNPMVYEEYSNKAFNEYFKASGKTKEDFLSLWIKGRSEFLKEMLDRKVIMPWSILEYLDTTARINMKKELDRLESQTY